MLCCWFGAEMLFEFTTGTLKAGPEIVEGVGETTGAEFELTGENEVRP